MVRRGGSISEMTEMEFYEGKKEDSQIHYSMMRRKTTQEGMVTHVMDIC
jgi:hypothetical protein